ncbi:MAG: ATP-binding protein, partial [Campylobacter hyointestinalis]
GIKSQKSVSVKVIFYGSPGTGKTMSALSLAKSLKKQILSFDCSKILSKYVGESEQNVRKIFDTYKEICAKTKTEPVLLLNEADQFLSTRTDSSSGSDKMHNQMQNIFLEQIEKFEGVLIATPNFMQSLDHAFSRRFDYKIEFKKPDLAARLKIWQKIIPQNASFEEDFSLEELAKFELSGAQIVLVLKNTALKVACDDEGIFTMEAFEKEIKRELSSSFGEDKKVGLL